MPVRILEAGSFEVSAMPQTRDEKSFRGFSAVDSGQFNRIAVNRLIQQMAAYTRDSLKI